MRYRARLVAEELRRKQFERMVARSLQALPEPVRTALDNVEIVIEDNPPESQDGDVSDVVFGLYEGIPLTERTSGYGFILPDKISIYRRPLERAFDSPSARMKQVRVTVIHEIAHHFGMSEDQIDKMGFG